MRQGQPGLLARDGDDESPQVNGVDLRNYRMNRKLTPDEQSELAAPYEASGRMSASTEITRLFGMTL